MPLVRRTAAGILRTTGARAFLDAMLARGAFASQEALMTCEIVAGAAKDLTLEERLAYVDALLPHMTGWATCDLMGSAVKVFREDPAGLLGYVASKLADENPWAVRVAEVWLLEHYRAPEWVPGGPGPFGGRREPRAPACRLGRLLSFDVARLVPLDARRGRPRGGLRPHDALARRGTRRKPP